MTRLRLCLLAGLLCLAPAAAEAAKVNIIRPPKQHHRPAEVAAPRPVTVKVQVVVVAVPFETRRQRVDRKLFQTWTGFYKVYSGRRYPF